MDRLTSIDYLRASSMLYIVAYLHLVDYASQELRRENPLTEFFTSVVLAIFVLVSGYLLGGAKTRRMSAVGFYKRRLLRIYPLYALAIAVFYLVGINDGWTSVKGLLGIAMYVEPPPLTLWFISMLVLFYLVTPLLLRLLSNWLLFAGAVAGMILATLVLQVAVGTVDLRVLLYFPAFCLGLYCANDGVETRYINARWAVIGLFAATPLAFVSLPADTLNYLKIAPLVTLCAYLTFYLLYSREAALKPNTYLSFLSYSSFAMYLFHRPVYTLAASIYLPESIFWQPIYLLAVCFGVVAPVAWMLQRGYDVSYAWLRQYWHSLHKPLPRSAIK